MPCSGAVKLMGLDEELVKSKVDDIIGLPTMLKMAEGAELSCLFNIGS